jgi:hypothetical protein
VHPTLAGPEFFWDERLSFPGKYRLRLELQYGSDPSWESVLSSETTLTVLEPQGQDALVWKHMLELTGGRGWSGKEWVDQYGTMTAFILENARDSDYLPYVVGFKTGRTDAEVREEIEHAIALRPEGPIGDVLRSALGGWYVDQAREALGKADLDRALEFIGEAKRRIVDVNRSTAYSWIRENGERWLAEEPLLDEGGMRGLYTGYVKAMSSFTEPVVPSIECVDPGTSPNDPYIVWFGYRSSNRGERLVERGKGNNLIPSGRQEPPRVFQPGWKRYGFSVTTHADEVTWNLDGRTVTATRSTQPRCPLPNALLFLAPLRPVVECVTRDGQNITARFGYENPNTVAIRLPAGENNRLTGTREQPPTIFEPGRSYDVFRVTVRNDMTVSWSVGGKTATATATSASPCNR